VWKQISTILVLAVAAAAEHGNPIDLERYIAHLQHPARDGWQS
jgi:hypothetical protein